MVFSNFRSLTFDNSKIKENLINFPVLVRLSGSNFDFSYCQSSGQDIRFASTSGYSADSYYSHEIECWDPVNNLADIWVKIPTVASGSGTIFYMMYGDQTASSGQGASGVWDPYYKAVLHFKESGTTIYDSTSGSHHGTVKNPANLHFGYSGVVVSGVKFDNYSGSTQTSDSYIDFGASDYWKNVLRMLGSNTLSFSFLNSANRDEYIASAASGANQWNWGIRTLNSGIKFTKYEEFAAVVAATPDIPQIAHPEIYSGMWNTVDCVLDVYHFPCISVYINGTVASWSGTLHDNTDPYCPRVLIGRHGNNIGNSFSGVFDEFRFADTVRSSGWIYADYCSKSNQLLTVGGPTYHVAYSDSPSYPYLVKANIVGVNDAKYRFISLLGSGENLPFYIHVKRLSKNALSYSIKAYPWTWVYSDPYYLVKVKGVVVKDSATFIKANFESLNNPNYRIVSLLGAVSDGPYKIRVLHYNFVNAGYKIKAYKLSATLNAEVLFDSYPSGTYIGTLVKMSGMLNNDTLSMGAGTYLFRFDFDDGARASGVSPSSVYLEHFYHNEYYSSIKTIQLMVSGISGVPSSTLEYYYDDVLTSKPSSFSALVFTPNSGVISSNSGLNVEFYCGLNGYNFDTFQSRRLYGVDNGNIF